jgi:hypothetical protein
MHYRKLTPWPFIDPEFPPAGYQKVGESVDWQRSKTSRKTWYFFTYQDYLIIADREWLKGRNGKPGKYASSQYEYPIAGARWFVDTVERFFLQPDDPNAVPRDKFNVREEIDGETLGVTRGAAFGGRYIPGYSFDNLNRIEHSTVMPEGPFCQMFKMGDPWLFEDGLFDLFREIAERHERGEFQAIND